MKRYQRVALLAGVSLLACGSQGGNDNPMPGPGSGGSSSVSGAGAAQAGSSATAGNGSTAGGAGSGGSAPIGGAGTSGNAVGGAGNGGGGSGGTTGGGGGDDVAHPLVIDAAPELHTHTVLGSRQAGVDTRLPKIPGKLIVNVEVDNGGIYDYGIKHGFHVLGLSMFHCAIPETPEAYGTKGRDFTGNCRWETLDGQDHDASANVAPAESIMGKVKAALTELAQKFPEEGWPYFLNAAGDVRWTDVGFTGYSHGGTSSVRWAKKLKVWRAVARSAPRDNLCGKFPDGQCPDSVISNWLDEPSATPVENMYGLDGTMDGEYKDIAFAMERLKFPGVITDITKVAPPYNGSHRLVIPDGIEHGHDPFTDKRFWPAMDVIWATPAENVAYANSH